MAKGFFPESDASLKILYWWKADQSGLNEYGPNRLVCLNAWSLVGGTVWEGLGGVALLEEVYHLVIGI